jgi:hypothetical protein
MCVCVCVCVCVCTCVCLSVMCYILFVKCPLKVSCVEGLVSDEAVFRGEALGRWLDHEGSDLISGLSHWLIHSLINLRKGLALSGDHEMRSSPLPRSSAMVFCLIIGPKAIRPRGHGLKVLKLWAKIKLSSF